jgi:hypothetical protein
MRICIPTQLSDLELIAEVARLARLQRDATARLVAHLVELEARNLALAAGFPSLFDYCREVLHLSEGETSNRIMAARVARRFPVVLDLLDSGALNLTSVRLLSPHLTQANHRELFDAVAHRKKADVAELIAHRFPRPDIASSIRKVPVRAPMVGLLEPTTSMPPPSGGEPVPDPLAVPVQPAMVESASAPTPPRRAVVAPLSAGRYEIRFTATAETRAKLQRAQEQLSHAVPPGDVAAIFDRALTALLEGLARTSVGQRTDRPIAPGSRHVPKRVKRAVWLRDGGQCVFVARGGRRCSGRAFLEFHHRRPYAIGGEASTDNIELRCRAHNAYEAELFYGPLRDAGCVQEPGASVSARARSARASTA